MPLKSFRAGWTCYLYNSANLGKTELISSLENLAKVLNCKANNSAAEGEDLWACNLETEANGFRSTYKAERNLQKRSWLVNCGERGKLQSEQFRSRRRGLWTCSFSLKP